jgi:GH35 family endo-1,4-beta-xylanase
VIPVKKLASILIGLVFLGGVTSSSQPPGFWEEERAYQAALQYIEQNRKSDVSIKVVDQASAPVKHATVAYQQTTHDFAFGFIGSPGWATPSDVAPGWKFFEFTRGRYVGARSGKALFVFGEDCRSGSCLHVKVSRDQNLGINSDDVAIEPGVVYEVTFWIKVVQAPPAGIGPTFGIYWGEGAVGSAWQGVHLSQITPRLTTGHYMPVTLRVTAPGAATRAIIGVRLNMEGARPGDVEFYLDDVTFTRSGSTQNLLRNPSFEESEARAWALWSDLCQSMNAWIQLVWFEWPFIEPQPDVFQWEATDYWFQRILDRCPGARFIFLFSELSCGGCPRLGTQVPAWVQVEQLSDPLVFERFKQDLYDYVYRVAQRYASKVEWWSTMNELNWKMDELLGGDLEKAIEINRVMIKAIRDADPQAKVLLAAGFYQPDRDFPRISPFEFAQRALQAGLQVDGITLQAWPSAQGTPVFYQNYVRQLASLGKPVFIQETGYPSQPTPPAQWWQAWGGIFDEPTQAAWVKYITTIPYGTENVLGVLWVFAVDNTIPNRLFSHMGLFTRDGQTKQAYDVYRQHIRMFTTTGNDNTDESGKIAFRGFAGEYTVTVTAPDGRKVEETIHVREKAENNFTITLK